MRWWRAFLFVPPTLLAIACGAARLDVGGTGAENLDAGEERVSAPDTAVVTPLPDASLRLNLAERCALSPGAADRYRSASELTARLVGRWHLCNDPFSAESPLPDGAVGIELLADGTYYFLRLTDDQEFLRASVDDEERGTYRYYAYSDPDAGAAIDGGGTNEAGAGDFVARDDPTVRRGLFLYLRPRFETSPEDVLIAEFETGPRRLFLARVGASTIEGSFVAIGDITLK